MKLTHITCLYSCIVAIPNYRIITMYSLREVDMYFSGIIGQEVTCERDPPAMIWFPLRCCNSRCACVCVLQKAELLGENRDDGSDGVEERLSASGSDEEDDKETN